MSQKKFLLSTEQISKGIAHFTIGFARLTASKTAEDAESAGSGTLVTIGSLHGILTSGPRAGCLTQEGSGGNRNICRSSIGFSKANRHEGVYRRSRDAWKRLWLDRA